MESGLIIFFLKIRIARQRSATRDDKTGTKFRYFTNVAFTRFDIKIYGTHMSVTTTERIIFFDVSGSNTGSFGRTNFIEKASTRRNTRVNNRIPTYHLGNIFFFEKNKKAMNNHAKTRAMLIVISHIRIGAQSGLYALVPGVVSASQDPLENISEYIGKVCAITNIGERMIPKPTSTNKPLNPSSLFSSVMFFPLFS
jgi:hypothetical protein